MSFRQTYQSLEEAVFPVKLLLLKISDEYASSEVSFVCELLSLLLVWPSLCTMKLEEKTAPNIRKVKVGERNLFGEKVKK